MLSKTHPELMRLLARPLASTILRPEMAKPSKAATLPGFCLDQSIVESEHGRVDFNPFVEEYLITINHYAGGAMTVVISIQQLETAINRARKVQPAVNNVLATDLSAMAEVYALMIFDKSSHIDVDQLGEHKRSAVTKWLQASPTPQDAPACALRPGDPGQETCEACQ